MRRLIQAATVALMLAPVAGVAQDFDAGLATSHLRNHRSLPRASVSAGPILPNEVSSAVVLPAIQI